MLSSPRFLTLLLVPTFAAAACLGADLDQQASPESEAPEASPGPPAETGGGGASSGGGTKKDDCKPPDKPIDPSSLLPCPSYLCEDGGAHCVPAGLVPPDQVDMLGWCNADQICVPDKLIASNATLIPKTCSAVMGLEGRCTSSCIPMVADSSDLLDQDSCDVGELCVPCYDPITLAPTGACDLPCDTGPVEPAPAPLPTCCEHGEGTCVPADVVPEDQAASITQDSCPDAGQLCVPTEMMDPAFDPIVCVPSDILVALGIEEGNCIPDCVDAVKGLGRGSCPAGYQCAPCDALGSPTGACPEDW